MTVFRLLDEGEQWLFGRKRAAYGLSAMRICLGVAILGSLIVNFADRHYVWGPGARWLDPWLTVDYWGFPFTVIFGVEDSSAVFTLKYLALTVVAVLFTLGWRTRFITPVLLLMLTSLMRLNPLATDAGDNLIRISLLFFCLADVSMHWSLDARRRRRGSGPAPLEETGGASPGERPRWTWPAWPGVLFHNVALLGIAGQVFVVYVVSGMSKVQGSMWQEGVGLYYPLRIDQYAAWPALNEIVYASGILVTIGSYITVFVQVFFPLLLMRRGTRVVALVLVFFMHVGIAVTMALPWFSLAILAADAIFIRDETYRSAIAWVARRRARRRGRGRVVADDDAPADLERTEGDEQLADRPETTVTKS
ncbi:HTTM domain-containing protein [Phytoactinopolyspora halotolerans]|uniref:HTTM domain-containing protein n=1 Tax=Phytoactinopolyspora halotolerans TaxID=1981512 RepID=A0A6L9S783_9ACTN|nr:HTTM domain-containing protein [Phytoactinopolyspora halotolerans]NEE00929.1 HTTM domain-containing protein [Phytoactinopolyspora halotolerans]